MASAEVMWWEDLEEGNDAELALQGMQWGFTE